jgi:dTDP-glucose pyrophosphorylase
MWAVVPVAGRATRLCSQTGGEPKALLEVGGRPLLDRLLESLADAVSDACLIVDRLDGPIAQRFGQAGWGIRLHYARQPEPLGVGDAVLRAREHVAGAFVVAMGDVFYSEPLGRYVQAWRSSGADGAVLTEPVGDEVPDPVGVVHLDGPFVRSIAKARTDPTVLRVCGMDVLPEAAFGAAVKLRRRPDKELEVEEIISWLIRERNARFLALPYRGWRRNINTPADMARVHRWLAEVQGERPGA